MPEVADIARLEAKVDKLTDAVMRLVLIEERQTTQGERIGAVEQRVAATEIAVAKTDRTLSMWINRGIGVWAVAVLIFTLLSQLGKLK
jgi:hypothetical protein